MKKQLISISQKIAKVMFSDMTRASLATLDQLYYSTINAILKEQPENLIKYGYSVYSQNEEDGIIHEIFNRIGSAKLKFTAKVHFIDPRDPIYHLFKKEAKLQFNIC